MLMSRFCVKNKFNASYKDIPDDEFEKVIKYVEYLKNQIRNLFYLLKLF